MFMSYYCYVCSVLGIVTLCCSVYCLCVNVYCTTATGVPTQLQLTNISYHIKTGVWEIQHRCYSVQEIICKGEGMTYTYSEFYRFVMEVCIIQLAQHSPVNPPMSRIHANFKQIFSLLPHTKNKVRLHYDDQPVNATEWNNRNLL
jgi:hypothetical protein